MATFKDRNGRDWVIDCNVITMRRVNDRLKVNLLESISTKLLQDLADDPGRLVDVLYVLCEEQCTAKSVTDEDFGYALVGEAIEKALDALVESLLDFFPPRRSALLRKIWEKVLAAETQQEAMLRTKLDGPIVSETIASLMATANREMDAALKAAVTKAERETDARLAKLIGGDESTN